MGTNNFLFILTYSFLLHEKNVMVMNNLSKFDTLMRYPVSCL